MMQPVPKDVLERLAALAPATPPRPSRPPAAPAGTNKNAAAGTRRQFDRFERTPAGVRGYLQRHGVDVRGERRHGSATYLYLAACPVKPDCTAGNGSDIAVVVADDGKISYKNLHDRGADLIWADVREALEPGYKAFAEECGNKPRPNAKPNGKQPVGGDDQDAKDDGDVIGGPVLVCMADVEPKDIRWLWPGKVAMARIGLLVGRPGEGKSFLTTDMTARVTTGSPWPDGSQCPKGSVIIISAEDDPGDTIRPRLDAHHADVRRVHLLSAVRRVRQDGTKFEVMFTLADVAALEAALKAIPDCKLIIVDPIGSFLGGDTDSHRDNEVRGVLAPVARLAEKYGPAVLVVAHRRKSMGNVADDLALGSRAFTGIARTVWHLSRDPDNKARRLLLPGKNNLAPEGNGLAFTICGQPPRISWERDPVVMSADDALAVENGEADEQKPGPEPEARNAAADWLTELLAKGEVPAAQVKDEAKAAGLAWRTVQRAADTLSVIREKNSFNGGWQWRLPEPGFDEADPTCQVLGEEENSASWHLRENSPENTDSACHHSEDAKSSDLGTLGDPAVDMGGAL